MRYQMYMFIRSIRRAIAYNLIKDEIKTVNELAKDSNGGMSINDALVLIFGYRR